jgi:hypothetical protein
MKFFRDNFQHFQCDIAMLGHIHKHQQLGKAVYSSSLVQRSFNEGLRYDANGCIYDYRDEHGYVLWNIDAEAKKAEFKFMPMFQPVLMVTFVMSKDMTKDKLLQILKSLSGRSLSIKLILDDANPEALAFMYNYCNLQKSCVIKKVESIVVPDMLPTAYGARDPEMNIDAYPEEPARAPRSGALEARTNVAVPDPLMDAVSNGVLVAISMLAEPCPDETSCPDAGEMETRKSEEPVVVMPPYAVPTGETARLAELMLAMLPACWGSIQERPA